MDWKSPATAPCGSAKTAQRPTSWISFGSTMRVPPADVTRAAAASRSSTTMLPSQCAGSSPSTGPKPPWLWSFTEIIGYSNSPIGKISTSQPRSSV
jgi:hypothetical protein